MSRNRSQRGKERGHPGTPVDAPRPNGEASGNLARPGTLARTGKRDGFSERVSERGKSGEERGKWSLRASPERRERGIDPRLAR